jgi:hypothetical protein
MPEMQKMRRNVVSVSGDVICHEFVLDAFAMN